MTDGNLLRVAGVVPLLVDGALRLGVCLLVVAVPVHSIQLGDLRLWVGRFG